MQYPGYIDVCSDLVRGDESSILLPTMELEILCSLSSSIAVADGRVLVVCHCSLLLIVVVEGRDFGLSATTA